MEVAKVPCTLTQLPPLVITVAQYQNQENDIGTMHVNSSNHFIACVDLCNHNCNQDTELFHHHEDFPTATPL